MIDEEVKVQISQTSWEAAIYNYAMPPRLRCKTTYTVPNSHLMMPSTACVVDKASCHPLALISVYLGVWMAWPGNTAHSSGANVSSIDHLPPDSASIAIRDTPPSRIRFRRISILHKWDIFTHGTNCHLG